MTPGDKPKGRRRIARRLLVALAVILVLPLTAAGYLQVHLAGQMHRVGGAFSGLTDRPDRLATGTAAVNFLVLTTDRHSRSVAPAASAAPGWTGARHVDSVSVLHLDGNRRAAVWVTIPMRTSLSLPGGPGGAGRLGDVLPRATPAGLVGGVEGLSDLRIDHLAVLDWAGLAQLVTHDESIEVPDPGGTNGSRVELGAQEALGYVHGDLGPGAGDVRREQYLIRAVLDASLHQELRRQPLSLYRLLDTLTRHLAVESGWSSSGIRNLAISLRNMRSYAIQYTALPKDDAFLWRAVRNDQFGTWATDHPGAVLAFATG